MRTDRPPRRPKPPVDRRDRSRPPRDPEGPAILYGHHAVVEALRNPRRQFQRLLATENALKRLQDEGISIPRIIEVVRPGAIDRELTPDAVHQGLLLEADPLVGPDLDSLPDDSLVLVLDQITDPHNVGAIIRTAAAFAAAAIVTTARHSPEATGVLAKSASGGLEHIPIITVRNLSDALDKLAQRGFQRVGLDSEGDVPMDDVEMHRPLALVLGAEGKGLRQKTRTFCDVLARLDMPGAIKSLNVSNATAIALHTAVRKSSK